MIRRKRLQIGLIKKNKGNERERKRWPITKLFPMNYRIASIQWKWQTILLLDLFQCLFFDVYLVQCCILDEKHRTQNSNKCSLPQKSKKMLEGKRIGD